MKTLSKGRMAAVSMGNFGHGLLTGLVMSWLIYFFQPTAESGIPVRIPTQGVLFGVISALGLIKAFGHVFDAITDPLVASSSDRCRHKSGRRIPFMKYTAIPFAVLSVLVFMSPVERESYWNALFLAVILYSYYLVFTLYIVPYNALLPELVTDSKQRINLFTMTSLTFILGTGGAYLTPSLVAMFTGAGLSVLAAWRLSFALLAALAMIALLIPVWAIREKDYVTAQPSHISTLQSIRQTFHYPDFRVFVVADLVYFIALAFFQAAMGYYVAVLLGMPEWMMTVAFVVTMAVSVLFYVPINLLTKRVGKKTMLSVGYFLFTLGYVLVLLFDKGSGIPVMVQAGVAFVIVAVPLAIFGILPNTIVSDLAEYDTALTGEARQGMFFAARSFVFKLGQSVAFLIIPTVAAIGKTGGSEVGETGVRLTALVAAVFCAVGFVVFRFYNEKRVLSCKPAEAAETAEPT